MSTYYVSPSDGYNVRVYADNADQAIEKYLSQTRYLVIGCEHARAVRHAHQASANFTRYWVHGVRRDGTLAAGPLDYVVYPSAGE